ncbi:MAG TPA: cytochrome c oxidase subunit 3 [Terriglobales bacterium]|nr:cytochrome c oxidase subunit 3 [Terriglobales bacterium]
MSPTSTREPRINNGGAIILPPILDGGGGDGRGGSGSPNFGDRLRRARLGLAVGITPVIMLFVSLTSAYIVRQGLPTLDENTNKYIHDWLPVNLPWLLLLINSFVLIASSVTIELSRRAITREAALAPVKSIPGVSLGDEKSFPWLGLTIALGGLFLFGQWMAWRELSYRGFYLATSPSSSFVYLLTGMHALHLAGGIIALLYAGTITILHKPVESRRVVIDITAWYWHFMALLWIYIFALIEFAR